MQLCWEAGLPGLGAAVTMGTGQARALATDAFGKGRELSTQMQRGEKLGDAEAKCATSEQAQLAKRRPCN